MALSAFLLIAVIVCSILFAIMVIFLMIYYGHPDDRSTAIVPKLIVLFGLWLAFSSIMILPYDVANQQGAGGLRVDILWYIGFICIAVLVSAVLPFAFYYYDTDEDEDDEKRSGPLGNAIKGTFLCATFFFVLCGIMFSFLGTAQIPVTRIAYNTNRVFLLSVDKTTIENRYAPGGSINTFGCNSQALDCVKDNFTWDIDVTFPIYIIALLSFIGWFFFILFFSVGLVALPMDLINDYRTRPIPMTPEKYNEVKKDIGTRASKLLDIGLLLKKEGMNLKGGRGGSGSASRRHAQQLRDFEQNYYLLKKDYDVMKIAWDLKGGNPLFYYFEGFLGLVGAGMSVSWWLHIIIFILPARPINGFLNNLLVDLETNGFNIFSICAYACYAEWTIWCSLKGNFKLGVRFGFLKIHPMEVGNTFLSSFIFNTWILLLVVAPAIQFCVTAFPVYSSGSDIDVLFGDQVKYLKFFKYFYVYQIFLFAIVIIAGLTFVYLMVFPKDRAKEVESKINAVAKIDRDNY